MILINEAKPLDLKCFAVFLILSSLIGVFGLIRQNKNLSRAAYVTFGVMLFGFPVGTILGIFGIKWMNSILPKLQ